MLGAAWTTGALDALQREYGWDPREAEVLIGTSAGSVLAASLGCGVGVDELLDTQRGVAGSRVQYDHDASPALPPLPRRLLRRALGAVKLLALLVVVGSVLALLLGAAAVLFAYAMRAAIGA